MRTGLRDYLIRDGQHRADQISARSARYRAPQPTRGLTERALYVSTLRRWVGRVSYDAVH